MGLTRLLEVQLRKVKKNQENHQNLTPGHTTALYNNKIKKMGHVEGAVKSGFAGKKKFSLFSIQKSQLASTNHKKSSISFGLVTLAFYFLKKK